MVFVTWKVLFARSLQPSRERSRSSAWRYQSSLGDASGISLVSNKFLIGFKSGATLPFPGYKHATAK